MPRKYMYHGTIEVSISSRLNLGKVADLSWVSLTCSDPDYGLWHSPRLSQHWMASILCPWVSGRFGILVYIFLMHTAENCVHIAKQDTMLTSNDCAEIGNFGMAIRVLFQIARHLIPVQNISRCFSDHVCERLAYWDNSTAIISAGW